MPDSKDFKRAAQTEELITEAQKQNASEEERVPKREKSAAKSDSAERSAKKKNAAKRPNLFLSPSFMMLLIVGIAFLVILVSFISTFWRISKYQAREAAATEVPSSTEGPPPIPTPKPVPEMPEDSTLSQELLSLNATAVEWNKKEENPEDKGLYFISKENADHIIYNVDGENLCQAGYTFDDFEYIWINSESDDFYTVINISGTRVDLSNYYILVREEKGLYASRVIINCYEAQEVVLNNTIVTGTILAPQANIKYNNTYIYGQVRGKSYEGTIRVRRDIGFTGYNAVMSVLYGVDFENAAVKKRVIELLKDQDTEGRYAKYDLSSSVLQKDIERILVLDLSDLGLRSFGSDLELFDHIISLDISKNDISSFDLSGFPNLQAFYMGDTAIREIDVSPCTALKTLDISNTNLTALPDFSLLPRLEYLNCSNAGIRELDYWNLQNLKHLDISANPEVKDFDFGALPQLEQLDIRDCGLSNIDLRQAEKLWFLRCSGNVYETLDLNAAPTLIDVEAYTDTLKEVKAQNFLKRQNAALFCYETTKIS